MKVRAFACIVVLASIAVSCTGEEPTPSSDQTVPSVVTSGPSATATDAPSTTSASTAATTVPPTIPELPGREAVAIAVPPRFASAGTDIPVVVSVGVQAVGVELIGADGTSLGSLTAASPLYWTGTVPRSAVVGDAVTVQPVARLDNGREIVGSPASIPVLDANGLRIERRLVELTTTDVYDRPWSTDEGELAWIAPGEEGEPIQPAAIARLDSDEVAVLDTAASRVTCFDLEGNPTCSVGLPLAATGDMFAIGDGTLAVVDLRNRNGDQELHVLRINPHLGLVETLYHEFPLDVAGYPAVATNTRFQWDAASSTAWVGLPEQWSPPSDAPPDFTRFPITDALHLSNGDISRGPSIRHPGSLRPDVTSTAYRLVNGQSWVTLYDTPAPYYDTLGLDVTSSGVVWLLLAIGDPNGGKSTVELVRWRPGDPTFDASPIDFGLLTSPARTMVALDDDTVAVLDRHVGGRIRAITFAEHDPSSP